MSRTPETIASAVAEYACELIKSDSARALSVLRLAARLRENAHEIAAGGQAAPEMEALLSAASLRERDEHPPLYWVRAVTDDILGYCQATPSEDRTSEDVSDSDANDSRFLSRNSIPNRVGCRVYVSISYAYEDNNGRHNNWR